MVAKQWMCLPVDITCSLVDICIRGKCSCADTKWPCFY